MRFLLALLLLTGAGLSPAAGAECVGNSTPLRICDRCTNTHSLVVKRDTPCDRSLRVGSKAALMDAKIRTPAKFGRAGVSGANYAYQPRKGFVGKDSFVVEWTFIFEERVQVTYYEMLIDVVP